jgi:hypothetical protein
MTSVFEKLGSRDEDQTASAVSYVGMADELVSMPATSERRVFRNLAILDRK